MKRRHVLAASTALWALPVASLRAATFPDRPVTLVVPFAAGGTTDIATRKIADVLKRRWNQSVLVVNKPGAGTIIAAELVARSAPDGLNILIAPDPTYSVNPLIFDKLPYDPFKDFAPVTTLITYPLGIAVSTNLGVNSLKELVELSKTRDLNYGSFGVGTAPQLVMELFKSQSGLKMEHIPYNGIAPVLLAMQSGEVHATVAGSGAVASQIKAGKLKMLAMDYKTALFPEIPTFTEAGYPNMHAPSWWGVTVAAGTSKAIAQQIRQDLMAALEEPEIVAYLQTAGYDASGETGEVLAKRMRDSRDMWAPIVKAKKIRVD